jgi:hypothetical protein
MRRVFEQAEVAVTSANRHQSQRCTARKGQSTHHKQTMSIVSGANG